MTRIYYKELNLKVGIITYILLLTRKPLTIQDGLINIIEENNNKKGWNNNLGCYAYELIYHGSSSHILFNLTNTKAVMVPNNNLTRRRINEIYGSAIINTINHPIEKYIVNHDFLEYD